jgi:hypothetical protein
MKSQRTNQTKTSEHDRSSQVNASAKSAAAPAMYPMLHLQQQIGNQAVGRLIQAKLTVGEPNDAYEQEADRVAAEVVRQIHSPQIASSGQSALVQRQAMGNEEEELRRKPLIQCKSDVGGMAVSSEIESSIQQARGSGQPLAEGIRKPMEQAFGADFSGVRVHTDERSDRLNREVGARAFTTGKDIFFRQGEYSPGGQSGKELVAHELAHVVQQGNYKNHTNYIIQRMIKNPREILEKDKSIIDENSEYFNNLEKEDKDEIKSFSGRISLYELELNLVDFFATISPQKSQAKYIQECALILDATTKYIFYWNDKLKEIDARKEPYKTINDKQNNIVKFKRLFETEIFESMRDLVFDLYKELAADSTMEDISKNFFLLLKNESEMADNQKINIIIEDILQRALLAIRPVIGEFNKTETNDRLSKGEWVNTKKPLFVDDDPKEKDVKQGGLIGDCWLMSVLSALAKNEKGKKTIKEMIKEKQGSEFYEVTFWEMNESTKKYVKSAPIAVSKDFPAVYKKDKDNNITEQLVPPFAHFIPAIWPAIIEKAYAVKMGGYNKLVGGRAKKAIEVITGMEAEETQLKQATEVEKEKVKQKILNAIKVDQEALVVGTKIEKHYMCVVSADNDAIEIYDQALRGNNATKKISWINFLNDFSDFDIVVTKARANDK